MAQRKSTTSSPSNKSKPYFSDTQRKQFQDFIQELGTRPATEDDFLKLESIYSNDDFKEIYHHYYNDIGSALSQQSTEQLDYIGINLQYIKTNYTTQKIDIHNQIEKLYDHSFIRILEQRNVARISNETQTAVNKMYEQADQIEEKLEKNKFDYITILGIFATIVVTFVGSFAFSSSVLQNIHSVSFTKLVVIACIIGLVFCNMVWLLADFIVSLTSKKLNLKIHIPCIVLNAIFFIIISATSVHYIYNKYDVAKKMSEATTKHPNFYEQLLEQEKAQELKPAKP